MIRGAVGGGRVQAILVLALVWPVSPALAQGFGGTVADHLVRGDSLLAQAKGAEAAIQFEEARTLCPTPAEIVSSLQGEARAKLLTDEPLQAVGLLEEAVTRFPDDPRASNLLYEAGIAAQRARDFDRATDLYRKAIGRNPTPDILPSLKVQLGYTLHMRGRQGEAVEILKDFEKDFPGHALLPNALYELAIASHDLGTGDHDRAKLKEAAAIYQKLIKRFPGTPAATEAHFEIGLVLAELGRRSEAADSFTRYVSVSPGSPLAAAALEKAADLMLIRSPRQSAQLYALALVKAKANPPADPGYGLSRWLGAKQRLAGALSRIWVVALAAIVALGLVLLLGRLVLKRVRRIRKAPDPVSA
ncbi:MAG: hypothetical protein AUH92_04155 [Acidobacteria bacterium 13_1_40CM_4_69_4]|nr:MAG: hypothetical protein AUH92_04155 [Acidobacteria bacterium 13_1_40CM_4_69_4]